MKKLFVISMILFASLLGLQAQFIQSKLDVVGGISAREYVHIGLRYQYTDITQVSLAIGSDMEIRDDEDITTYSLDHMVHFGQLSYYTNRPAWYARQGITYSVNIEGSDRTRKFTYLNLALGREFAVNNWLGFNADLGLIWLLNTVTEENQSVTSDNLREILPLARFQVFISF
jgi:hypothetical protein